MAKASTPAAPGWFKAGPAPALIGSRCTACKAVFFPPESTFCRNPDCAGDAFEPCELSRRGKLWSYTTNNYQPPAPYVPPSEPYEPFAVAAVELEAEQMVVLGQVPRDVGTGALRVGMEMEVVVEPLFADDENEYLVWKWRPVDAVDANAAAAAVDAAAATAAKE